MSPFNIDCFGSLANFDEIYSPDLRLQVEKILLYAILNEGNYENPQK